MKNEYASPFSEFLESDSKKYVAFISKRQYVIEIDQSFAHEYMTENLAEITRPNMLMDNFGNPIDKNNSYYNDTIILLGYRDPFYMQIQFPERDKISLEQFNCLKEVLNDVKNHRLKHQDDTEFSVFAFGNENFQIEIKDYKDCLDELLESCSKYIEEPILLPEEVIIGKEICTKKVYTVEMIDEMLAQMEENKIDENGNPILGDYEEYKIV